MYKVELLLENNEKHTVLDNIQSKAEALDKLDLFIKKAKIELAKREFETGIGSLISPRGQGWENYSISSVDDIGIKETVLAYIASY